MSPLTGRLALALLPLLVGLAGCAPTIDVFPLDELAPRARASAACTQPVRLYVDDAPRCPFTPIARLTVTPFTLGEVLWTEQVASMLRTRARAIGADAVVGLRQVTQDGDARLVHSGHRERTSDSATSRAVMAETTAVTHDRREWLEGMAVRFREQSCRE